MIHVLFVESNKEYIHIIAPALRENYFEVILVSDIDEAMNAIETNNIQMIVADSRCGGSELTAELRGINNTVPVIILTENSARSEMRKIYRSGADGFMVFPIDPEELQMRIKNLLWRCNIVTESSLRIGRCILHSQSLTVETVNGDIELKRMEFLLLEKLMSYPGKIFTRPQLMDDLWGYESESDPRTIDTHIRRLRKKFHDVDDIRIQTVRGLGYRAVVPRRIREEKKED